MTWQRYLKFAMQVFFTGVAGLVAALVDDRVDTVEWINTGILMLGAISVLGAGELPEGVWKHMKTYVSAASAALVALVTFTTDGAVTTTEYLQIVLAAVAALGVAIVPGPKVYDALAVGRAGAAHRGPSI